ncbi:enhanced serine sensitivity protein SseB C-terminal domain-containing protein [Streptacidiphilus sp. P02-A3a]|uniref:enhanced serine sensitivity protein SseB C-terminal domain-containing protein n=1 Tax=Streptacidiphilus sp. P02-A3a TaxID=2704468 RepID=UPI001CDBA5CC|nr:enhanced serine sensitivity protein SseB C-terminal domain-containing protein [Streptacidiphilus sp. P02-A3a]QMU72423.1 enhanced serine sensitivity protein SseB [Streptacidiphilus sp. P02-A3a]
MVRTGDGDAIERALRGVAPGRYEAYEELLRALGEGQVWMLLWHGESGQPDAQYGNLEVGRFGYAPCVTSAEQLAASGWPRAHQVSPGREIAASLYRERWGLWLNPHQPGGGVGVPWTDLRRIAGGLDRLPAGPLRIEAATVPAEDFYTALRQAARNTPAVRSLRRGWVRPAWGEPYLAIGLDLYEAGPAAVESVRLMMEQALPAAPTGVDVSTVAMSDPYDPVALWLRVRVVPFYDRESAVHPAYGYPQPLH